MQLYIQTLKVCVHKPLKEWVQINKKVQSVVPVIYFDFIGETEFTTLLRFVKKSFLLHQCLESYDDHKMQCPQLNLQL